MKWHIVGNLGNRGDKGHIPEEWPEELKVLCQKVQEANAANDRDPKVNLEMIKKTGELHTAFYSAFKKWREEDAHKKLIEARKGFDPG